MSKEKELLREIEDAAPEDKAERTQELLDYFNSKKSSKKKKPVGKGFSGVKSSLKGGRKSVGGLQPSAAGSSTGGPIAAGTGISAISFGTLLGKKISNAFQNAKEEKERAQQAEAAGAEVPDEVKEKGYFIKKALGYEFGGRAFDTTFGAFVSSMPAKQSAGNAKFSDQFDYGENDPKNKGKEKTIPQILAKGFKDVSKAFGKVSDRLTRQNNLLKSVLDQSVVNGELLEKIKDSISALNALEMQSDEDTMDQVTNQPAADQTQEDGEAQPQQDGFDLSGMLDTVDDALDIAKHLKGKKTKRRRGVKRRYARKKFGRMFGRRLKLAAGGTTMGAVPAMLGEAGPELVTNRFMGPSAFGVGGMKGGQYLGLAQPLATAMEMPIKASGGIMLSNMGGFLRAAGPMGGALAPMFASLAMPMTGIFGMSRSMINSAIFGSVASLQDSADYISNIFKNVFGILNLNKFFKGGPGGGGDPTEIPDAINGPVPQGNDADFWSLAAIASREDVKPQGSADVAQSIYNRVASGAYSVKTIKDAILSPGQYQPTFSSRRKWAAIKDRETAIAAAGSATNVDSSAKAIMNPTLQKNAKEFVQGRTDFLGESQKKNMRSDLGDITRGQGSNFFGWHNNYKENKIAGIPKFNVTAESGTSTTTQSTGVKYTIISGPDSGYKVPTDLVNGINVEGHGQELIQTSSAGFKIFPLENKKYSLSKNPKPLVERWGEIAGASKSSEISNKAEGGGWLNQLGKFLPGTGTVMAPSSGGPRDMQGIQQTNAGFQDKILGIPLGRPYRTRGEYGEYTQQENRRYYEKTGKYFVPTQFPGGARGIHGLYTPPRQQSTPPTSNRQLDRAIQNARDVTNMPGGSQYKPLVESAAKSATRMQTHYDQLREAMREAGMKGAEESMDMRGNPKNRIDIISMQIPSSPPIMQHSVSSSSVTPDYRKMAKDNAMLRYS